ncbi:MAG: DUF126 domain-containing protein [Nitrososphaeria archaeon]
MRFQEKIIKCKVVGKKDSSGNIVFSDAPFNFYLTNPLTSEVIEEDHPLKGKILKNSIVVLPSGKGSSVVQVDGLYQLKIHNNAPAGLIILNPEATIVSACFVAEVTLATGIDKETFDHLKYARFAELSVRSSEIRITY